VNLPENLSGLSSGLSSDGRGAAALGGAKRFPLPLRSGDRLLAIAPSGCLRETAAFERGLAVWRSRGYQVDCIAGYDDRAGYLAGTDAHRRSCLLSAWRDPSVKGVLCVRGGYGGTRLLEGLAWRAADLAQPKWLVGFSDITSLLWSLAGSGVGGVHGPVLTTLAAEPIASQMRLFDLVEGRAIAPLLGTGWGNGAVSGWLLPANLTVATSLLGTAHQPDLTGAIVALEDVGEQPYRLDRMLTQWRMLGLFDQIRGVALGRFSQAEPPAGIPSWSVAEVLRDRLGDLGIPVVSDLPFGHDGENWALPCGAAVAIDGDAGQLTVLEMGTSSTV